MIVLKTSRELALMREAGHIAQRALREAGKAVEPGVSTWELDKIAQTCIEKAGAKPSFLGYGGFPASACISVNHVVIHGIPSKKQILKQGDIVSIDVGALFGGFHGDNAWTFPCGDVSKEAQDLMDATRESLFAGIAAAQKGARLGDIGHAVQTVAEAAGFGVVREYVGHGVGRAMHEDPNVPNWGKPHSGPELFAGMVIAIEPMVNLGTYKTRQLSDGWTVVTRDGKPSAHFEKTVAITDDGPILITAEPGRDRPVN
jgi:methionyl aminopeptidase